MAAHSWMDETRRRCGAIRRCNATKEERVASGDDGWMSPIGRDRTKESTATKRRTEKSGENEKALLTCPIRLPHCPPSQVHSTMPNAPRPDSLSAMACGRVIPRPG